MAIYPSSILSITNPIGTNLLSSPDHATQHSTINDNVIALETKVGVDGSADTTSMDYMVKNAASNGGGHVQTANKGGTGQTSYTKGDTLAASSSSVLGKLAVGSDTFVLTADSTQTSGMKWAAPPGSNKIAVSGSILTIGVNSTTEASLMSVSIPATTLGTSNVVKATVYISDWQVSTAPASVLVKANFGTQSVASMLFVSSPNGPSMAGIIEYTIIGNGVNTQRVNVNTNVAVDYMNTTSSVLATATKVLRASRTAPASQDTSSVLTMGFTITQSGADVATYVTSSGYTVEKIA